ncbi:hypothetical protein [Asanoa siamensis]|uniref:Tat pathway signal sequence domain protein n=1 Tax=Asanoa siamensis TaxID=926357 RepID=A0ABQ4CXC3_9ACTN|nr:hypothetical protein [Asanoa siamensis]GIF75933.1 hypothetical protein Asi02nite_54510 [Asanoa siamensis]
MIDLTGEPPPRLDAAADPAVARWSRRQVLLGTLGGLVAGGVGAYGAVALTAPDPLSPAAASVTVVDPAGEADEFVDLARAGPTVTVSIGRSGRCAVTVGATIEYGSTEDAVLSQAGAMSFAASGANDLPPSLDRAARSFLSLSGTRGPFTVTQPVASTSVLEGLRPGATTFTAKYRVEGGSRVPVFFSHRSIVVTPLP